MKMNSTKTNNNLRKREQIISLIKQDVSIPKISKKLNVGKSTIYYHYKKIKGRKYPLTKIPKDDKVLGEFLGAFAGDGSFFLDKNFKYVIRFHLNSVDDYQYALYLKSLIANYFNKKANICLRPPKAMDLKFCSKDIASLIYEYLGVNGKKTANMSIKKPLSSLSKDFLIMFIRGLIDTDGHVNKNGYIVISLIAKPLILQISQILKDMGIENKVSKVKKRPNEQDQLCLRIPKKDTCIYTNLIGFSNLRKNKNAAAEI